MKKVISLVGLVFIALGCAKTEEAIPVVETGGPLMMQFDHFFEVADENELKYARDTLYFEIRDERAIYLGTLESAILGTHAHEYKVRRGYHYHAATGQRVDLDHMAGWIGRLVEGVDFASPHRAKKAYEAKIEEMNPTRSIRLNPTAVSIFDFNDREMTAYSGTVFNHLLMLRQSGPEELYKRNSVTILEAGHILPGYILDGELYGIETTETDRARIRYGRVEDLDRAIRVVDTLYFLVAEIFKPYLRDSAVAKTFIEKALEDTEKQYNIPTPRLETRVQDEFSPRRYERFARLRPEEALFGFGEIDADSLTRSRNSGRVTRLR